MGGAVRGEGVSFGVWFGGEWVVVGVERGGWRCRVGGGLLDVCVFVVADVVA